MTLPSEDLRHIVASVQCWEKLRCRRVFLTGSSGFVGRWLAESFEFANNALGLQAQLVKVPRDFFPSGKFDLGIHAAKAGSYLADMLATERMLDFAAQSGVVRLLFTSSGAVYGKLPGGMNQFPEDFAGSPDSDYGRAKRDGESLCIRYADQFGFSAIITRLFTFSGPALPLAAHFAIGNFIRDVIAGGPVMVQGDGTSTRSYLYAADLAVWLWTLLLEGLHARAYNVGSPEAVSISQLASAVVANTSNDTQIVIKGGEGSDCYVPAVERAWIEHRLRPLIPLDESIRRMFAWNIRSEFGELRAAQPTTS